jgi:hypothetical protein
MPPTTTALLAAVADRAALLERKVFLGYSTPTGV